MWLRFCLTLSLRDAEEIKAHRGVDVSDETMRAWTVKFGPKIAANLRYRKLPSRGAGAWARWSARVHTNACSCGVQLMMRARVSTSSFRSEATHEQR
jgi:hypothetical protein